eukprot:7400988-Alexandrium_andersonii.AAC.1
MLCFTHGGSWIEADCGVDGPCADCGLHFGPPPCDVKMPGARKLRYATERGCAQNNSGMRRSA